MKEINILYASIEGNTKAFINKIKDYAKDKNVKINAYEINDMTELPDVDYEVSDYFIFVPTYLDGGNGIDNGVKELMTNSLGEYIEDLDNGKHCLGIVGSGNRNFNQQFCLTARRYAAKFNSMLLDEYELRGTNEDVKRIYNDMIEALE